MIPAASFGSQFALFFEDRTEILTVQILHGDELEAVLLAQVENPDDVAVCDLASEDEFLLEPPENFGICSQLRPNNFKGNQPIQFPVSCLVNSAHSTLPEKRKDFIAPAKNRAGFKLTL
jgi:hypothetical protein